VKLSRSFHGREVNRWSIGGRGIVRGMAKEKKGMAQFFSEKEQVKEGEGENPDYLFRGETSRLVEL